MIRSDTARYFRVATRFWTDETSSQWPQDTKLLALYLLTNSHRTLEGIFILPVQYALADLKWSKKRFARGMAILTKDEFLRYDAETGVLLIRNALRYQTVENDNQAKSVLRRIADLPGTPLRRRTRSCWHYIS